MSRVPGLSLDMNADDGLFALGFAQGMMQEVRTDRHIASILKYSHSVLAQEFDQYLDMLAINTPFKFSHMYDGTKPGNPATRLWSHSLRGRGKTQEGTFNFRQSVMPMLTAAQRQNISGDPMSKVSNEDINMLAERGNKPYIFYNKAMVIEYGLTVHISPITAKALFIPTGNSSKSFVFKQSVTTTAGSPAQHGAFISAWAGWWGTTAERKWGDTVRLVVEKDLGRTANEMTSRKRAKSVGMSVASNPEAAFKAGRDLAIARVKAGADSLAKARSYTRRYGEDW